MMKRIKDNTIRWRSFIDGKSYDFEYRLVGFRTHLLYVNGQEFNLNKISTGMFVRLDEPFTFDGKEARLVRLGKEIDVAYNDTYLRSKNKYVGIPKWVWFFVFMCLLLPLLAAGAFSIVLFFFGFSILFLHRLSTAQKTPPLIHDVLIIISCMTRGGAFRLVIALLASYLCVQFVRYDISIFLKLLFCTMITGLTLFIIFIESATSLGL